MKATKSKKKPDGGSLERRVIQPGARVLIINNHPWAGHTGVIEEAIFTLVGAMWRVNLDNGANAGVTGDDLKAV